MKPAAFHPGGGLPAEFGFGFAVIADEKVDLGGAEQAFVEFHVVAPVEPEAAEGGVEEFADRVRLVRGEHVVVGLILLEHAPHAFHVFLRVAPVAFRIEIAKIEFLLQAGFDARGSDGDLARDERLAAAGGLVVEENAAAREKIVGFAVIHRQPMRH